MYVCKFLPLSKLFSFLIVFSQNLRQHGCLIKANTLCFPATDKTVSSLKEEN